MRALALRVAPVFKQSRACGRVSEIYRASTNDYISVRYDLWSCLRDVGWEFIEMKIHSPSMAELHAFVTAARLGSFTRAAEELCVTQGAVSRAVARLESHFSQPLLIRTPGGLEPTPAGARLLEGTRAALEAIERVSRDLR